MNFVLATMSPTEPAVIFISVDAKLKALRDKHSPFPQQNTVDSCKVLPA